jgi:6-phosphogluconolactonase (cycloisomerase 2 family)
MYAHRIVVTGNMLYSTILIALLTSPLATAVNLYVASYSGGPWAGNITSLSLAQKPDSTYSLAQTHTLNTSTNSPSWLTLNRFNNVLYLIDEAVNSTTNGNLVAYKTSYTGELTEVSRTEAQVGGVHGVFFASGQALAVPHYTGSILQTYRLYASGKEIKPIETFNFSPPDFKIGPVADRQEAPHPHQTVLDPTQQFILVPDLGADLVHVFSVDQKTMKLHKKAPLKTSAGYGPRHAVFSNNKISGNYVFYLVGELAGAVTAYSVSYKSDELTFHKIASYSTLNPGQLYPLNPDGSSKVAPAAIDITVGYDSYSDSLLHN